MDHTTNGPSIGVDGWLYLAGGDFGFINAEGTDKSNRLIAAGESFECVPTERNFNVLNGYSKYS